ncbi:DNA-binding GntR family transcriptional regulator [Paenibacillus phyllosphaerae]|uniref:DNA-binding GntR family transcriptional regulator n=1 Tax=Paenibacillus phyllosphaerae TaxID=274593 RepID=A0A7W5FP32_9BACL|nr:GntR family transcriptional regulator [Paenibacillus phyllosphaerae]MBB3111823.1 DNA-binding GntR family transcriptional regulator [Paenibacillus phyllosphaerae]
MGLEHEQEIYRSIKQAIIEQKLRPNMQLVEEVLAESFGVSRTPVRNVVRKLASEKLVTMIPYRGAFVSCPTIQEAKEVFEMRQVIEAAVVRKLCGRLTEQQIEELGILLEKEHEAQANGDIFGAISITGSFHLKLAELSNNSYYSRSLEELISLTYVIIALYGEQQMKACMDHHRILDAIRRQDAVTAERLMREHLQELEDSLRFEQSEDRLLSLADIFKTERQAHT